MTDQTKTSADQKEPSDPAVSLDAEQRRRMREAAEAAAREAPGEWRAGEDLEPFFEGFYAVDCEVRRADGVRRRILLKPNGNFPVEPISRHVVETQPSAVLALLDALEEAERECDALQEKLAAAERRVAELEQSSRDDRHVAMEDAER